MFYSVRVLATFCNLGCALISTSFAFRNTTALGSLRSNLTYTAQVSSNTVLHCKPFVCSFTLNVLCTKLRFRDLELNNCCLMSLSNFLVCCCLRWWARVVHMSTNDSIDHSVTYSLIKFHLVI